MTESGHGLPFQQVQRLQGMQEGAQARSSSAFIHVVHCGCLSQIKTALMTWVTRDCNNPQLPLPPFLRNKVAQTLVAVLQV